MNYAYETTAKSIAFPEIKGELLDQLSDRATKLLDAPKPLIQREKARWFDFKRVLAS
ncbi:MAG: hypothetical protein ABJ327_18930 [Litoreibacter sp.]